MALRYQHGSGDVMLIMECHNSHKYSQSKTPVKKTLMAQISPVIAVEVLKNLEQYQIHTDKRFLEYVLISVRSFLTPSGILQSRLNSTETVLNPI